MRGWSFLRSRVATVRLDRLLLPSSLMLVALSAFLSERNAVDLQKSVAEVERLNRVNTDGDLLLSALKDIEAGQRGYLLTGDAAYLQPFNQAVKALPDLVENLRHDASEPAQKERVSRLVRLIGEKRAEVAATILIRDQLGPEAALSIVKTDSGRKSMDSIRAICAEISREDQKALLANSTSLASRQRRGVWWALGITGVLFLMLVLASIAIEQGVRQRDDLILDLSAAQQQYQTTLMSIGDGVVATDATGTITFLNHVAGEISGWRAEDAIGKRVETVLPLVDDVTGAVLDHPVHRVLKSGETTALADHALLQRADSSEVPVDDSAAPIFGGIGGRLNGVVMVFRDISARYEADRAIGKWEHVFRHAGFGMALLALDGEEPMLEQVNPAFASMHGYAVEELRGQPLRTVIPPTAWETELQGLDNAEQDGHLLLQTTHVRKDGSSFPALADVTVVRNKDGAVQYGTAYYSDITERIHAEEELRKNEARFRNLAESLPQLVWTATPDGASDYFNSRWEAELGLSAGGVASRGFLDFVHEEDHERCAAEWKKSLLEGSVFQSECRLRGAKQNKWYICRAVPMRSADGRIVRWFGSCTDIDEQRKSAEALQVSRDELQRSNFDLEQFAFAASHDLQEPLRMVVIYSQLLNEEYGRMLEGKGQTYLKFAVDGALRMELLLKSLLTYSRATAPGGVAPQGGVAVSEAVGKALANLELQIEDTGAAIEVGELPVVDMPEVHLVQVFQNLLSNAIKYRRPDVRPEVEIGAVRQGHKWLFSVRDNGIGIESKYKEHIFRVFGRLHGAEYPGTGIGLALCQRLIERNGGRIWVASTPGAGSTFFFTLPERIRS